MHQDQIFGPAPVAVTVIFGSLANSTSKKLMFITRLFQWSQRARAPTWGRLGSWQLLQLTRWTRKLKTEFKFRYTRTAMH
jgi:hypothetical protein